MTGTSDASKTETAKSNVKLALMDPLGSGIGGLKYQIRDNSKVIAKGVTDPSGKISPFVAQVGSPLIVYVEHFVTKEMKQIKTLIPWADNFNVKLLSAKVKELMPLRPAVGSPGAYKRKTYIAKAGDTLEAIAKKHETTIEALKQLNKITPEQVIRDGQVIKIPLSNASALSGGGDSLATKKEESRGANGTPKLSVALRCEQSACIKTGATGVLVEEINIRLMGFGGTVTQGKPLNEFTTKTEAAVKQFQRDFMKVPETGKVCGAVLQALDRFRLTFSVQINAMKCLCGNCGGFGLQRTDSRAVEIFRNGTAITGKEYPGMHRALIWLFRAALFYTSVVDKELEYLFLKVASGYRCWNDNKRNNRTSTNHMGNALDLHFRRGATSARCEGRDVDELREKIFIERLGAQLEWRDANRAALESARQGARSWVHVDVRNLDRQFMSERYYAVTQGAADGEPLLRMVRNFGMFDLLNCGGLPPRMPDLPTDRTPINALNLSARGRGFIKGWRQSSIVEHDNIENAIAAVRRYIHVPLYQHEYDALVSIVFDNSDFQSLSKLISHLNTLMYSLAADEVLRLAEDGPATRSRRQAEARLFRNCVYDFIN